MILKKAFKRYTMRFLRKSCRHPNHGNTLLPTSLQLERIFREQGESPQSFYVKVRMVYTVKVLGNCTLQALENA